MAHGDERGGFLRRGLSQRRDARVAAGHRAAERGGEDGLVAGLDDDVRGDALRCRRGREDRRDAGDDAQGVGRRGGDDDVGALLLVVGGRQRGRER